MEAKEKILLTVEDIMEITSLSRPSVYSLLNSEGFPHMRIGRRYFVLKSDFDKWLEEATQKKACIS